MAGADLTTAAAYMKENYNDDVLSDAVPKAAPGLYFLPKFTDFTGNNYIQPIKYSNPQAIISGSSGFSNLTSNPGNTTSKRFVVTSTKHYGIVQIDRELILASSNDEGAFVSELDNEIKSAVDELGRDLGRQVYGTSAGTLGKVSSISSHVITLVNKGDAANFEVGMTLDSYTATSGGSAHDAGLVVTAVNETSGTVTVTGDSTTTTNDYLFRQNSRGSEWNGLQDWLPTSAPSPGDSFFGVDRSASPRLYGQSMDGSTDALQDLLNKACMKVEKQGGKATHILCPFEYYVKIANSEQVQKRYAAPSGDEASLGFAGIEVITPYGVARVYPDRFCPSTTMFVLSMDSWKLVSRLNLVQWTQEDGTIILRQATADAFQARIASYSNLLCMNPVANLIIYNLPDAT